MVHANTERETVRDIFERHKDRVYSIALRYSGNEAEAMDIAQDTFLKLCSSMEQFRGESSLETYIYRVVVNCCLDRKRRAWRMLPLAEELAAMLRAPGRTAVEEMLRREMRGEVQKAVAALPPDLRIVVVLRYTEGLAYDRIAEVLATRPGTVASRLNRAHGMLERKLKHLEGRRG